jgi:hypothetical protein
MAADDSVGSVRVRANARLTALTGVVLLVLFVTQVVTVVADLFHWISPGLTDAGERRAIVLGAFLVGVLLAWALIWHVADYVALH